MKDQPMLHVRTEDLLLRKMKKRLDELAKLRYWSVRPIESIRMRETTGYEKLDDVLKAEGWKDMKVGDEWAGNGEFGWFRLQFTVPEEFAGKKLAAAMRFSAAGWQGGEGCLFVDGVPYQGIDPHHPEAILADKAEAGKQYDLVVECVSTPVWQNIRYKINLEQAEIAVVNPDVWDYYYDLEFIISIAEHLPVLSRRRATIVRTANKSVDAFDMEAGSFEALGETARKASRILSPLYKSRADASALELACAGHAHIDVAWLWPYAETVRKCARTFSTVNRLMEEYPHYLFTQSQAQLYEFTREHYPALYEKIKKRVNEGRFEPQGSMWVEADCNICSGESLVRQIILGKGYFKDEFGVDSNVLWLPDVFGYSAAVPQILKKSGVDYFATFKIAWNQFNRMPYTTFWWEGIDGTRVLSHLPPNNNYNGTINPPFLWEIADGYREKDRSDIALVSYGWGDGGGGPDRTHMEHLKRAANLEGIPRCTPMAVGDFFKQLERRSDDLPTWVGELYFELHRGTYTTQAQTKRSNRKSEFLLRDAEMASALAWVLKDVPYPADDLLRAWKLLCKNQFHDVIPGSSVTDVYKDAAEDYKTIAKIGESVRTSGLNNIGGKKGKGPNLLIFNSLSWQRTDPIRVEVPGKATDWHAEAADGKALPSQASKLNPSVLWIEPGPTDGIGVSSLRLAKGAASSSGSIKVSPSSLENRFYRVKLDRNGLITSIYDKRSKREVLPRGVRANVLQLFEDKPIANDAWDIDFYYRDKGWEITEAAEISVEEAGPVRGALRIRRKFGSSEIDQRIVLWGSTPRIDFETRADWHENKKVLKAAFPVDVHANSARFEIQFGSVDRPNHWNTSWDFARFEVAAQKWADLSQADRGVSLLNDCKYGYDVHENVMRLTLLCSPKSPDPHADMGEHFFTYSLLPHDGDWRQGETVRRAYELNVPMIAWLSDGTSSHAQRLIGMDAPNVIVETVKQAERDRALIVRMYECAGTDADCRFELGFLALDTLGPIDRAVECDLLERDTADMKLDQGALRFAMKPFEIKTVKLNCR